MAYCHDLKLNDKSDCENVADFIVNALEMTNKRKEKIMNQEEQIEEMVEHINDYIGLVDTKHWYGDELDEGLAKHLYNAGYRKEIE